MYHLDDEAALNGLREFSAATFDRFDISVDVQPAAFRAAVPLIGEAIAAGYTDALVMPPAAWQHDHLAELAAAFASNDGWEDPYVDVGDLSPLERPAGPYLLLVRSDSRADDDLRGLTAPGLRRSLGTDRCLTVTEYLVLQRTMFDRYGDHRFDDYSADPSGWMWLADSTDGTRTAMGYWNPSKARVEVAACKTGSKNLRKGARRCRIVALDVA